VYLKLFLDIEPLHNDGVWDRIRNLLKNSSVPLNSSVVLTLTSFIILQLTIHNWNNVHNEKVHKCEKSTNLKCPQVWNVHRCKMFTMWNVHNMKGLQMWNIHKCEMSANEQWPQMWNVHKNEMSTQQKVHKTLLILWSENKKQGFSTKCYDTKVHMFLQSWENSPIAQNCQFCAIMWTFLLKLIMFA